MFVHCLAQIVVAQIPMSKMILRSCSCQMLVSCQVSYGSCPQWDGEADAQLSVHLEANCVLVLSADCSCCSCCCVDEDVPQISAEANMSFTIFDC